MEVSVFDVLRIIKKRLIWLILVAGLFWAGGRYVAQQTTPQYAYSGMMLIPSLGPPAATSTGEGLLSSMLSAANIVTPGTPGTSDPKKEILAYLDFHYMRPPTRDKNSKAKLVSALDVDGAHFVNLVTNGISELAAREHLQEIAENVKKLYEEKVESTRAEGEKTIALLERKLKLLKEGLGQNNLALEKLGPSLEIYAQRGVIEGEILKTEFSISGVRNSLLPTVLYNVSLTDLQPVSDLPVKPRVGLTAALSAVVGTVILLYFFVLFEIEKTRTASASAAGTKTSPPGSSGTRNPPAAPVRPPAKPAARPVPLGALPAARPPARRVARLSPPPPPPSAARFRR